MLGSVPRKCGPECAGEGVKEKKVTVNAFVYSNLRCFKSNLLIRLLRSCAMCILHVFLQMHVDILTMVDHIYMHID